MIETLLPLLPGLQWTADVIERIIAARRLIENLRKWGYLSFNVPGPETLEKALATYQARYGLPTTGRGDEETLHLMSRRFCGCADSFAVLEAGALPSWPHREVTFASSLQLRQLDLQAQRDAILGEVLAEINRHCGLSMRLAQSGANIVQSGATARSDRQLDGAGGTLAYAYLPSRNTQAKGQLRQVIDLDERWGRHMLFLTVLHETCHNLGLGHNEDSQVAVLDPHLNLDLKGLQPWDIAQLVARYGPPVAVPTPPVPPAPPSSPGGLAELKVLIGGQVYGGTANLAVVS